MMKALLLACFLSLVISHANSQSCTPQGNQTSYGTNNVWVGYVYDNTNFTNYRGYVTEGVATSPNFDQSFGGDDVNYPTNGCSVFTSTFSVRYRLTKTFTNGSYDFIVGGDDGYRLSLDGGNTWVINRWVDQSYNTTGYSANLNGTYNIVLEFYENGGGNRISFSISTGCTGNTNIYGTGNVWNGYVYDGINFDQYKGIINRGSSSNPSFDENFGSSSGTFSTNCTTLQTETFSIRFRLTKTFSNQPCSFFIGGDDGYRFSLDGGLTWVINRWNDQAYTVSSYTATLNGTYNLVLEYYESGGENRINFTQSVGVPLPVKLTGFSGTENNNKAFLSWTLAAGSNPHYFEIEKSIDGINYSNASTIQLQASVNTQADMSFSYIDPIILTGKLFYRLKITDLTGLVIYSKEVVVTANKKPGQAIRIFPSILSVNTALVVETVIPVQDAVVTITNLVGIKVYQKTVGKLMAGQSISLLPGNNLVSKGIYYVSLTDGAIIKHSQKIVVQ